MVDYPAATRDDLIIEPRNADDGLSFVGVGPYDPVSQKDDIQFQSYYQWVSLLFLLQGFAFFVPHFFWRHLENGTMKSLRLCLHDPGIPNEKQAENLNQLVEYFQRNAGRHQVLRPWLDFINDTRYLDTTSKMHHKYYNDT